MLNEPASSFEFITTEPLKDQEPSLNGTDRLMRLRGIIEQYMDVVLQARLDEEVLPAEDRAIIIRGDGELIMTFSGILRDDAEWVYVELDKTLQEWDMYPLLRENRDGGEEAPHVIHIIEGRPEKPERSNPAWNIALFVATVISVLLTGTTIALAEMSLENPALAEQIQSSAAGIFQNLWRGIPYAAGILGILVPHEMGHYLMMRRHNKTATLPYFIPAFLISPFGTFGAVISLRESLRNRKQLLDVGAAGPIAGFIIAVPVLLIGLATSNVVPITETGGFVEGNSLLYAAAKFIVHGEFLPNAERDVLVNQLAWAGWTGLFVTALNMLPLGQLDGGHVVYSLFGERARRIYYPVLIGMVALALLLSPTWLFFVLLLFFVGRFYAVPLDNITELDPNRRMVAVFALIIFIVSFTPVPLYERGAEGGLLNGAGILGITTMMSAALITLRYRLR